MEIKNQMNFDMPKGSLIKKISYVLAIVGPGAIQMSASMGPGTATSCLSAGAVYGYKLLWLVVLSGVLGAVVCYLGAKVTAISGDNAFEYIRKHTNKWFANILLAIILFTWFYLIVLQGTYMMHLTQVMFGKRFANIVFIITILGIGYIFTSGKDNVLKLASIMCSIMALIYLINAIYIKPDVAELAKGLIPSIPDGEGLITFAGIVGGSAPGIIALWYSFSVKDNGWDTPSALPFIAWDQGIFYGVEFVLFSVGIYLSGAAILHPAGIQVKSALDAAKAIEPLAGPAAKWIFTLGLWGAVFTTIGGMSSIASYGLNSLLNIGQSLNDKKVKKVIWIGAILSLIGGLVKMPALPLMVWGISMLNLGGPIVLAILLYFTNSKKHVGEYTNGWLVNILGFLALFLNSYSIYIQFIK